MALIPTENEHNPYTKSCDLGNAYGCYFLGSRYKDGKGVKQDALKAKALYTKACNNKIVEACHLLKNPNSPPSGH